MIKVVSTGYTPRPLQAILHRSLKRFNVLVLHRRFGKTVFALNELLDQALRCSKKNPQYAYVAPTYGQAKRIAWDMLKQICEHIPGATFNEADLRLEIARPSARDKIKIILLGSENPGAIRGIYLDGVVLDEFAECDPTVWTQVIRPALSDRMGWAIILGTPRGTNHFYELYKAAENNPDWFVKSYKASETGVIPVAELEAARAIMEEADYMQEFEVSFSAALVGSYYGKDIEKAEAEGRICRVPYDPMLTVSTYWDLGVSDMTAIWFVQTLRWREIRVIDYLQDSGIGLDSYAKMLKDKDYVYSAHVLPHDIEVRELSTGKSRKEILQNLLRGTRIVAAKRDSIADGINASRMLIGKAYFDKENCKLGIEALRNYQRQWDAKNKTFQSKPKHDWCSHAADGFRTLALNIDDNGLTDQDYRKLPRTSDSSFSVV